MGTTPTNLELYAESAFPDSCRCLGVLLQPISIGHLMLLVRFKNPFVTGERTPDAVDLAQAVALCSIPFNRLLRRINSLRFRALVWMLGILASTRPLARIGFATYLSRCSKAPEYWRDGKQDPRPPQTPYWVAVQITLMRDLGFSYHEALEMPAGCALWLCAAVWEGNDAIRLESDLERTTKAEILAKGSSPSEVVNG